MKPYRLISEIPQHLIDRYKRYELTSYELADLTGFAAPSIRRGILRFRERKQGRYSKTALIAARNAYRDSLGHLPRAEIAKLAHVSLTTASRIKKRYKDAVLAKKHQNNAE